MNMQRKQIKSKIKNGIYERQCKEREDDTKIIVGEIN